MASIAQIKKAVEAHEEPVQVVIHAPNGGQPYRGLDGKPLTISVLGSESRKVREAQARERRKVLAGRGQATDEEHRARRVNVAVASATDWSGVDDGKKDIPFSAAALRTLLDDPDADHILVQLEEARSNPAGFSGAASKD